jgi:vacuolar-type H+-ATPase subunit I/STV1
MTRAITPAISSIILLSLWLGAAIVVAAVVAPAAFDVLPTRTLAGALVGRVLPVLFWSGVVIGLLVVWLGWHVPSPASRTIAALVLVGSSLVAQLVIAPRIERVRAEIGGPLEALDPSNPLRQAFGRLHGMSVACLGAGGLAALVILVLLIRFTTRGSS